MESREIAPAACRVVPGLSSWVCAANLHGARSDSAKVWQEETS